MIGVERESGERGPSGKGARLAVFEKGFLDQEERKKEGDQLGGERIRKKKGMR